MIRVLPARLFVLSLCLLAVAATLPAAVSPLDVPDRVGVVPVDVGYDDARYPLVRAGLTAATLSAAGFQADPGRARILANNESVTIPVQRSAAGIQLLHAIEPGPLVEAYRIADQRARSGEGVTEASTRQGSLDGGERPPPRPTVATVTLNWADGQSTEVAVRYHESIGAIIRPWWHPVERYPSDMAHARLLWTAPLPPDGHRVAALHVMRIPNPRPAVAIASVTIRALSGGDQGRYLLWGLASDDQAPSGALRFVAPDGNDDHNGSWEQPWATLSHAAATISGGDHVYVRGGVWQPTARIAFTDLVAPAGAQTLVSNWPGEIATFDFSLLSQICGWLLAPAKLQVHEIKPFPDILRI